VLSLSVAGRWGGRYTPATLAGRVGRRDRADAGGPGHCGADV